MIGLRDICWLAGLIEGEGCFYRSHSITLRLSMTDEDVIRRAATLMGTTVFGPHERSGNRQPIFYCAIHGKDAAAWMMTLLPLLGIRRRAKALQCLARWKSYPVQNRDKEFCKRGHLLSGNNMFTVSGGGRGCRVCRTMHEKNFRKRQHMKLVQSTIAS